MSTPTSADMAAAMIDHEGAAPESAELFAGMLLDHLKYDENGKAVVMTPAGHPAIDMGGNPVPVSELISRFRREFPSFFITKSKPPAGASDEEWSAVKVAREAHQDRQRRQDRPVANPWKKGPGYNVTHQVLMQARDPALAAKMQAASR